MLETKRRLLKLIKEQVSNKILNAEMAIAYAEESKLNETKSTAGDKFETGRAMMQVEQEKGELQLAKAKQLMNMLKAIDINKTHTSVSTGSLVMTDKHTYFISIGIGRLTLDNKTYFVISNQSPIGTLLINKLVGDKIEFRGDHHEILSIT